MLSISDVQHIAKLANLQLTGDELPKFRQWLSEALDYIKVLDELDTSSVKPTAQVTDLKNVFREDEVEKSLSQKEALKNAKKTKDGYLVA